MAVAGDHVIDIPIGDECAGGCDLTVVLSVPQQSTAALLPFPELPVSPLFDATAPRAVISRSRIAVSSLKDRHVETVVTVSKAVASPGEAVTVTVAVPPEHAEGAEVALFVVDRARSYKFY